MRTIAIRELRERTQAVIDEVAQTRESFVLTDDHQPQAALVPYGDFLRLQELAADRIHEHFDQVQSELQERTANLSEDEIAADVATALAETRA